MLLTIHEGWTWRAAYEQLSQENGRGSPPASQELPGSAARLPHQSNSPAVTAVHFLPPSACSVWFRRRAAKPGPAGSVCVTSIQTMNPNYGHSPFLVCSFTALANILPDPRCLTALTTPLDRKASSVQDKEQGDHCFMYIRSSAAWEVSCFLLGTWRLQALCPQLSAASCSVKLVFF